MHHLTHLLLHSGQFLRGSHMGSHVNHVGLGQKVSRWTWRPPFFGGRKETPTIFDCKALEDDSLQTILDWCSFFFKKWDQQNQTNKSLISGEIFWFISQVARLASRSTCGEVLLGAVWPRHCHDRARRARDHRPTVQHGLVTGGTEVKKYSSRHRPDRRTRKSKEKPQKMRKKSRKMVGQRHKASICFVQQKCSEKWLCLEKVHLFEVPGVFCVGAGGWCLTCLSCFHPRIWVWEKNLPILQQKPTASLHLKIHALKALLLIFPCWGPVQ